MKTLKGLLLVVLGINLFSFGNETVNETEQILVAQNGYAAGLNKTAIVRIEADSFDIVTENGSICYRGRLGERRYWSFSDEWVQIADFSSLNLPGNYSLRISGTNTIRNFSIVENPFAGIADAGMKAYYFNRCSYPILPVYGGKWERRAGHPDTLVYVHSSAVSESRQEGFAFSSPGGWYDAGDYNKYIVNSSITTYTIMLAYEFYPEYWVSRDLNIPESGNRLPDILDEALYNLRWMLTMQDEDGGVYHKLTTKEFAPFVMPFEANEKRFVVQKNTAASLDFASTMAHASRLFEDCDNILPGFADSCKIAAHAAWDWCGKNPDIIYLQPNDIETGAYGDRNIQDEWFWAGVEMALLDGTALPDSLEKMNFRTPTWGNVAILGLISVLKYNQNHGYEAISSYEKLLLDYADQLVDLSLQSAYQLSLNYFVWGSNSDVANQGMIKMIAYEVTRDSAFLHSALHDMNYLTGVNPTGYCFITGFGVKSPMHIHHRVSASDNIVEPVPGFLAGGPNTSVFIDCPDIERSKLPALSYVDDQCSYSTNEIAINWNAPLTFLAGAMSNALVDL